VPGVESCLARTLLIAVSEEVALLAAILFARSAKMDRHGVIISGAVIQITAQVAVLKFHSRHRSLGH
jgi:hypothetical protein